MNIDYYLTEMIRFFIGFILLTSAWSKTKTFQLFTDSLNSSFNLPLKISKIISPIIIAIEWLLAAILLTEISDTTLAMKMSLILFCVFTITVVYFMFKNETLSCNCFGEEPRPVSTFDVVRNIVIIATIIFYLLSNTIENDFNRAEIALLALIGLIITIITINFHDVVSILGFRGKA